MSESQLPEVKVGVDPAVIVIKILNDRLGKRPLLLPSDIEALSGVLTKKHLSPGAELEKAGRIPGHVWIIVNGVVKAHLNGKSIDVLTSPVIIGDDSVILGTPLPYAFEAETPVNALTIKSEDFTELLRSSPAISSQWVQELALKLSHERIRTVHLLSGGLTSQLAGLLLERQKGGSVELTQSAIASLLNVHRASVSRGLHALERQGLIGINYASVSIRNQQKLKALVKA